MPRSDLVYREEFPIFSIRDLRVSDRNLAAMTLCGRSKRSLEETKSNID
jgi:hypothetical protein